MTAINDQSRTANASEVAAKASKDAALRGALRAFAGPHTRSSAVRPAASRAPSYLDSVTSNHDRHPNTSHKETPISKSSAAAVTPSPALTSPSTRRYKDSNGRPATAVAASRFSKDTANPHHKVALQKPIHTDARGLKASNSEPVPDALPPAGTVHGTKDYFELLHTRTDATSSSKDDRTSILQHTLEPAQPRPQLIVDITTAVAKAQGVPAEIQSPKPVRPSLGARPLEDLTDRSSSIDGSMAKNELTSSPGVHRVRTSPMHVANDRLAHSPAQSSMSIAATAVDSRPSTAFNISSAQVMRLAPIPRSATTVHPPRSAESQLNRPKRETPYASSSEQAHAHRIDSLANAIVASHLASSRAPSRTGSPGKAPKPPLPRRVTDHHSVLYPGMASHVHKQESRTPSPKKGIRQTMRKPHSPIDTNAELAHKHKRSHFRIRKHPHKHREGDRKRWRDEITETERKRYDGLWAANRDLHVSLVTDELQSFNTQSQTDGYVSNLVVRDIWSRSRLPAHVLEEIWELVDLEAVGRLSREAFVVGVWLVDQRLKGRKLPVKVGDSVWQSARGLYGLKMPRIKS